MKTLMKKLIAVTLVAMLLWSSVPTVFAANLAVDGKIQVVSTELAYGRTYVAAQSLKNFGLQTVVSGSKITVSNSAVKFEFTSRSNKVKVNNIEVTLDAEAYIKENVAYVPLKFVFETLNYTVGYNASTRAITLMKNAELSFPITIVDSGETYTFTKPSTRIVSLAPSITEILFAIGAGNLVVGRTKYCTYPAETQNVPSVGTLYEPNIETILDLEPDTVIAATHMNEEVLAMLQKAKISTLTQTSPAKIAEIYTLIAQLGKLTGKNYEARAVVSSMKAKEERITSIVKSIPLAQRKTVYYVVGTGKSEYSAGRLTFIHEILTDAGCINVAADVDKWNYSLEKLIEHNPEIIIGADYSYDTMKGSSNYSSLSALKNGNFVTVDTNVFSIPGPRVMDYSMKSIIQKIYPNYAGNLRF